MKKPESLSHSKMLHTVWGELPLVNPKLKLTNTYSAPSIIGDGPELSKFAKEMITKSPVGLGVLAGVSYLPPDDKTDILFDNIPITVLFERIDIGGVVKDYENRGLYGLVNLYINNTNIKIAIGQKYDKEQKNIRILELCQSIDNPTWKLEEAKMYPTKIYDWDKNTTSNNVDIDRFSKITADRNIVVGTSVQSDYVFCNTWDGNGGESFAHPSQRYLYDKKRKEIYLYADACYVWGGK